MTVAITDSHPDRTVPVPRQWSGRTRGGVMGNRIFVALVRWFGIRAAYLLLVPVAFYFLFFAPAARRASDAYRRRLGITGRSWLGRLLGAWRHFYSFGTILLDRVAIIGGHASKFRFEFDGEEHLRAALEEGKGLVLVSAHCGNWEGAAHLLSRLDVPVNIVALEAEVEHIRRYFAGVFKERRFSAIPVGDSAEAGLQIMAALSRGEIVAIHGDRVIESRAERLPFLGADAWFPAGPCAIAAARGSPLVHAFAMREGTYRYHFYAYPPEHPSFAAVGRSGRRALLRESLGLFAQRLEEKVRQYPFQWHNFYDFWNEETPTNAGPVTPNAEET